MSDGPTHWREVDLRLRRYYTVNAVALGGAIVSLSAAYVAGFRHTDVLLDLVVMTVSFAVVGLGLLLVRRGGAPVLVGALVVSTTVFAVGGTVVTPYLLPVTLLLVLVPVMVAYPYLGRRSFYAMVVLAVLTSSALTFVAELRRPVLVDDSWVVGAVVGAVSVPFVVVVIVYGVGQSYRQLMGQAAELRASRTRVATVADATRRSLERDLHDGAQQRLVAMSVQIGLASSLLEAGDGAGAARVLDELAEQNGEAVRELRELAQGIYPPLLEQRGLVPALQAAARRGALPVTVVAEDVRRHAQGVEAAAYFCVLEALTNAAKHSRGSEVTVRLGGGTRLEFSVADDGQGFDPRAVPDRGGLLGMDARVTAVGGTLHVESRPGSGTTVHGSFPVSPPATPDGGAGG